MMNQRIGKRYYKTLETCVIAIHCPQPPCLIALAVYGKCLCIADTNGRTDVWILIQK